MEKPRANGHQVGIPSCQTEKMSETLLSVHAVGARCWCTPSVHAVGIDLRQRSCSGRTSMGAYSPAPHLLHSRPGMELEGVEHFELQWSDEFDACAANGGTDPAKWVHEVGKNRNSELQDYREENARCVDGILVITSDYAPERLPDYCNHPGHLPRGCHGLKCRGKDTDQQCSSSFDGTFSSASIVSKRSFVQGQYDARIRIDVQDASWPAWWFTGDPATPGWPVDSDGFPYHWPADGGASACSSVDPVTNTAHGTDLPNCARAQSSTFSSFMPATCGRVSPRGTASSRGSLGAWHANLIGTARC